MQKLIWQMMGRLWWLAGIILTAATVHASAGSALMLETADEAYPLAPHVAILENPSGTLTLADVKKKPDPAFVPNAGPVISIGRSASAFWFKFRIKPVAHSGAWVLDIGKPGIGAIDLFVPQRSGTGSPFYQRIQIGAWRQPAGEELPVRTLAVNLPETWSPDDPFYMRVQSAISINFPLTIRSPKNLITRSLPDTYGFGILFGILISMVLYNFTIFLFLKDRTYLYYVLYVASIFCYITILFGHFDLVFDLNPDRVRQSFFVSSSSTYFFGSAFSRLFLNTRRLAPIMDKLIVGVVVVSMMTLMAALSGFYHLAHQLNSFLGVSSGPVALTAAVLVWRRNFAPAKYFLAAWLILMTGTLLYSIGGTLIPRTPVTVYTFAVGAGIESILLSLALADRIRLLRKEKEELIRQERRLRQESITDGMTGLYNRRLLWSALDKETAVAHENGLPLSLLILDVDNFKRFNDTHGHPEGDKVLIALADILLKQVRDKDSPCRYGGEEFVVVLPYTPMAKASGVAERIRLRFSQLRFDPEPDLQIQVTVSVGLAELKPGETPRELLSRADKALYEAKNTGKNRVVAG